MDMVREFFRKADEYINRLLTENEKLRKTGDIHKVQTNCCKIEGAQTIISMAKKRL